jgi:DNA-binding NarL/FixJ family response regulator
VRTVLSGHRYVSAALADLLITDMDADSDQPLHSRLSEREFQILCKLAAGRAVSQIGEDLGISVKTVSTYRSRIKTNADLTAYALRSGLISQ